MFIFFPPHNYTVICCHFTPICSVLAYGSLAAWVALISCKRGCATDAAPLYQYTDTRFTDLRRMTPGVNSAENGDQTQDLKILSQHQAILHQ